MRRRDLILGLGAAIGTLPAARAQQKSMPRVGVLVYGNPQIDQDAESFRRGMRDLGYADGENIVFEFRYGEGKPDRLPALAEALVRSKPQVLFAFGGDVSPAALAATRTIPVVFVSSADPVQLGFVKSIARPGGNATGVSLLLDEIAPKRLQMLREIAPGVSKVAFLYNPDHIDNERREADRVAQPLGFSLNPLALKSDGDLVEVLRATREADAEAVYVVSSRQTNLLVEKLVAFAATNRLPLVGGWGAWAQAGGLLSYGPNLDDMVRIAATYVDKIIKGAHPTELPVQQPTRFELVINLKTAKTLGLTVPQSLLAHADKVID